MRVLVVEDEKKIGDYSGPRTPGGRMTITRDDYVLGEDIAHS